MFGIISKESDGIYNLIRIVDNINEFNSYVLDGYEDIKLIGGSLSDFRRDILIEGKYEDNKYIIKSNEKIYLVEKITSLNQGYIYNTKDISFKVHNKWKMIKIYKE